MRTQRRPTCPSGCKGSDELRLATLVDALDLAEHPHYHPGPPDVLSPSITSLRALTENDIASVTHEFLPEDVTPTPYATAAVAAMAAEVAADPLSQLECQICFEQVVPDGNRSSSAPRTWHECSSCRGTFCFNCTRWYVQFKITEGEVSKKKLVCPAPQCQRALTSEEVARVVLPDALAKYEAFLRNQEPGIRFCPRAGCCAVLREPRFSTTRQVKCASCQQESCMRCGGEYHKLPLCRRFEKRFGHWRKHHNVRACPNCHTDIEKQGGCCHMKCFQCDEEFCWSCLRPWMQHDETLCLPLAFIRSKNPKFGCWAPLRVVTKTTLVGVGLVVGVAGVGVAIVVLPPLVAFHAAKNSYRRWQHRHDPLY